MVLYWLAEEYSQLPSLRGWNSSSSCHSVHHYRTLAKEGPLWNIGPPSHSNVYLNMHPCVTECSSNGWFISTELQIIEVVLISMVKAIKGKGQILMLQSQKWTWQHSTAFKVQIGLVMHGILSWWYIPLVYRKGAFYEENFHRMLKWSCNGCGMPKNFMEKTFVGGCNYTYTV